MNNKHFLFLSLIVLALFGGCKDKDPVETGVDFSITFQANYDGVQLEKNKDYIFGAYPVLFERFRMYLSDITLLKGTEEVVISEAEYLEFTPDTTSTNMTVTPKITFKNVPEGSYDGIRLGFGVKPENNAKQPSDFPAGSPLSIETDYWLGWKSYIFMVLDGKADPDNDGVKNLAFSYHCGSDPVYTVYDFNQHIHVAKDHPGLQVLFDVRMLLTNDDGSLYDIQTNSNTSNSANDTRVAKELVGNFDRATTMKQ